MPNAKLERDVLDELLWDESINPSRIDVSANGGEVTLSGAVGTFHEKWDAGEDAWRVSGVEMVRNEVVVDTVAERLSDLTKSPALLGVIAACVYVFGALAQYTIGKLIDRYSLKAVSLPLSFMLAPFLYLAATLSNLPLILAAIGIVMGAFGQVTVNDAMVGKYTSEEWRGRAYAVRYFIGFTAAGASVGLVAWLYEQGGFVTMLHAFAGLCLLVIAAAIILPREIKVPAAQAN